MFNDNNTNEDVQLQSEQWKKSVRLYQDLYNKTGEDFLSLITVYYNTIFNLADVNKSENKPKKSDKNKDLNILLKNNVYLNLDEEVAVLSMLMVSCNFLLTNDEKSVSPSNKVSLIKAIETQELRHQNGLYIILKRIIVDTGCYLVIDKNIEENLSLENNGNIVSLLSQVSNQSIAENYELLKLFIQYAQRNSLLLTLMSSHILMDPQYRSFYIRKFHIDLKGAPMETILLDNILPFINSLSYEEQVSLSYNNFGMAEIFYKQPVLQEIMAQVFANTNYMFLISSLLKDLIFFAGHSHINDKVRQLYILLKYRLLLLLKELQKKSEESDILPDISIEDRTILSQLIDDIVFYKQESASMPSHVSKVLNIYATTKILYEMEMKRNTLESILRCSNISRRLLITYNHKHIITPVLCKTVHDIICLVTILYNVPQEKITFLFDKVIDGILNQSLESIKREILINIHGSLANYILNVAKISQNDKKMLLKKIESVVAMFTTIWGEKGLQINPEDIMNNTGVKEIWGKIIFINYVINNPMYSMETQISLIKKLCGFSGVLRDDSTVYVGNKYEKIISVIIRDSMLFHSQMLPQIMTERLLASCANMTNAERAQRITDKYKDANISDEDGSLKKYNAIFIKDTPAAMAWNAMIENIKEQNFQNIAEVVHFIYKLQEYRKQHLSHESTPQATSDVQNVNVSSKDSTCLSVSASFSSSNDLMVESGSASGTESDDFDECNLVENESAVEDATTTTTVQNDYVSTPEGYVVQSQSPELGAFIDNGIGYFPSNVWAFNPNEPMVEAGWENLGLSSKDVQKTQDLSASGTESDAFAPAVRQDTTITTVQNDYVSTPEGYVVQSQSPELGAFIDNGIGYFPSNVWAFNPNEPMVEAGWGNTELSSKDVQKTQDLSASGTESDDFDECNLVENESAVEDATTTTTVQNDYVSTPEVQVVQLQLPEVGVLSDNETSILDEHSTKNVENISDKKNDSQSGVMIAASSKKENLLINEWFVSESCRVKTRSINFTYKLSPVLVTESVLRNFSGGFAAVHTTIYYAKMHSETYSITCSSLIEKKYGFSLAFTTSKYVLQQNDSSSHSKDDQSMQHDKEIAIPREKFSIREEVKVKINLSLSFMNDREKYKINIPLSVFYRELEGTIHYIFSSFSQSGYLSCSLFRQNEHGATEKKYYMPISILNIAMTLDIMINIRSRELAYQNATQCTCYSSQMLTVIKKKFIQKRYYHDLALSSDACGYARNMKQKNKIVFTEKEHELKCFMLPKHNSRYNKALDLHTMPNGAMEALFGHLLADLCKKKKNSLMKEKCLVGDTLVIKHSIPEIETCSLCMPTLEKTKSSNQDYTPNNMVTVQNSTFTLKLPQDIIESILADYPESKDDTPLRTHNNKLMDEDELESMSRKVACENVLREKLRQVTSDCFYDKMEKVKHYLLHNDVLPRGIEYNITYHATLSPQHVVHGDLDSLPVLEKYSSAFKE